MTCWLVYSHVPKPREIHIFLYFEIMACFVGRLSLKLQMLYIYVFKQWWLFNGEENNSHNLLFCCDECRNDTL